MQARYGYRRTYVGIMVFLLVGGIGGGFSNTFALVLAARVAEGLAAGVVQPIPAIIIMRAFEAHEQGRASGIFGMGVMLAVDFLHGRALLPGLAMDGLPLCAGHRAGWRGGKP